MKAKLAIHKVWHRDNGTGYLEHRAVRIMAEAEGYAMVRRKGAFPYVAALKELDIQEEPIPCTT